MCDPSVTLQLLLLKVVSNFGVQLKICPCMHHDTSMVRCDKGSRRLSTYTYRYDTSPLPENRKDEN